MAHGKQLTFGQRLRAARREVKLSVQSFAALLGYNRSYIHKLESGRSDNPSNEFMDKCAAVFGINYDWLRFGELPIIVSQSTLAAHAEKERAEMMDLQILGLEALSDLDLRELQIHFMNQSMKYSKAKLRDVYIQFVVSVRAERLSRTAIADLSLRLRPKKSSESDSGASESATT